MKTSFYDEISKNKIKSTLLSIVVLLSLMALVYIISIILAPEASLFFLIFSSIFILVYIASSYAYGDRVVLAATKARPANPRKDIELINAVEGLSIAAGIPKPKIYVMESDEINAFATGRDPNHASICVTTGALEHLKRDELEGVVGHELSHVRNYDIRFAMVVAVMVGLAAIISQTFLRSMWFGGGRDRENKGGGAILLVIGIIFAVLAPIVVRLVQLAISRKREYLADASSAELTRYPDGLANALEKIMKINEGKMNVSEAVSHLFIADPNKSALDNIFATHPPLKNRIKILRAM